MRWSGWSLESQWKNKKLSTLIHTFHIGVWIKNVEEKSEIVILHNPKKMSKKNNQRSKKA